MVPTGCSPLCCMLRRSARTSMKMQSPGAQTPTNGRPNGRPRSGTQRENGIVCITTAISERDTRQHRGPDGMQPTLLHASGECTDKHEDARSRRATADRRETRRVKTVRLSERERRLQFDGYLDERDDGAPWSLGCSPLCCMLRHRARTSMKMQGPGALLPTDG